MDGMYWCFFYGTLKRGHYNFERFSSGLKFVQEDVVENYSLVNANPYYPHAVEDEGGFIEGEIMIVDERTFRSIDSMEIGAGYMPVVVHTKGGMTVTMYLSTNPEHKLLEKSSKFYAN